MADRDGIKIRLFVDAALATGAAVAATPGQAHYLRSVMRAGQGEAVLLFNGRDGEWVAGLDWGGKDRCRFAVESLRRPQGPAPDLWIAFAPLKKTGTDFVVEKATELGVSRLIPVFTRHTATARVRRERLIANAVEAAEQCGRLEVPEVAEPLALADLVAAWPAGRRLLVADETGRGRPLADALAATGTARPPLALMVGPEGGFADEELDALDKLPFAVPVSLGPRTLRAETAAVAGLACIQALAGDWRG